MDKEIIEVPVLSAAIRNMGIPLSPVVKAIAVGTLVTGRPPHRTVRAGFPHTAPTLDV